jgi:hypothetical protein
MAKQVYNYFAHGMGADGQTWTTRGEVVSQPGGFPAAIHDALRDSFEKLTGGRAQYGHPGKGCNGPYTVLHFNITLSREEV